MLDGEDREPALPQSAVEEQHVLPSPGREPRGQLVEEEKARPAREGRRQLEALHLPEGELGGAGAALVAESDQGQEPLGFAAPVGGPAIAVSPAERHADQDAVEHGEPREGTRDLKGPAQAQPPHDPRGPARDPLAAAPDLACGRRQEPAEDIEERGLAGAVRAEQPDHLALLDGHVDAAEREKAAECHADPASFKDGHGGDAGGGP